VDTLDELPQDLNNGRVEFVSWVLEPTPGTTDGRHRRCLMSYELTVEGDSDRLDRRRPKIQSDEATVDRHASDA
jgi:hypothetical protein